MEIANGKPEEGKHKVVMLILEGWFEDTKVEEEVLKEEKIDADIVLISGADEDVIMRHVADADAILTCDVEITKRILEAAKKCKIVAFISVGYNNIDISAAGREGIYVTNVSSYYWCDDEVSDHALALMLAIQRKITFFNKNTKEGGWQERRVLSEARLMMPLRGQTYGLVSFGRISRAEARKIQAFGCKVIATDPFVDPEEAERCGVKLVDFDTLLRTSDVISIHAPLLESTYHMFNEETIGKMKKTAYLVNTGRGPIVDQKALYNALKSGNIAGAALDVFEDEPPRADEPLFTLDNVIITPHIGAESKVSPLKCRTVSCRDVAAVLKGEQPKNWVNREEMRKRY